MPAFQAPARAAAAALLLACTAAQPVPDAPVVRNVEIEGNTAVTDSVIRARILTSETSWVPFSERQYLDENALETDLKRIVRLYQAQGFYEARIVERQIVPAGGKRVDVLIRIEEGPATRVSELLIEGLDDLPEAEQRLLQDGLPLAEGAIFTEEAYDALKNVLAERLRATGFAEASVEGVVQVDLDSDSAQVTVGVDHGQRYRFAQVFVAGANRVPRKRIAELAREAIPEGSLFNEEALAEAQASIFDLGVFAAVRVTRGAPDRKAGTVPVVVNVREAPFRTLRLGAGFGIDRGRTELPRATAEWTNRNFFGGLRRLSFENQLAWVFTENLLEKAITEQKNGLALRSQLQFLQPELFARNLDLTASVTAERGLEQSFQFLALGGSVGAVWRATRQLTFVPTYNLSLFDLSGEATSAVRSTGREQFLDACPRGNEQDGGFCLRRLAYLEQRLTYDRRDNPVATTRGAYLSISVQEGSRWLGSDYDYLRLLPEVRAFFPFGRHVLAARVVTGLLLPSAGQTSSVLTRFFLGGSDSQRGFGSRELSPRIAVVAKKDNDWKPGDPTAEALPVGGNGMLAANLEARFTLPADFGLVTFVDAGEVRPTIAEVSLRELHLAAGLGLRYRTVFGPIRLDLAYRLTDAGGPTADPFRPSYPGIAVQPIAGTDEEIASQLAGAGFPADAGVRLPGISRFSLHFSIGEAF